MSLDYDVALQASAEKLLALAASSVLPTLIPIKGQAFDWGFEYDFFARFPCEEGVLLLITEEMRRLIQQDIPLERMEMVPMSAKAFLQKKHPKLAAVCADYPATIVPLCKIKDFYDICPGQLLATSREIPAFLLYEMDFLQDSIIRIRGRAFTDKKEIKSFQKQIEKAKKNNPIELAEKADILTYFDGTCVWHPRGVQFMQAINALAKQGFEEVYSTEVKEGIKALWSSYRAKNKALPYRFYQNVVRKNDDADGLFLVQEATSCVQYTYCQPLNLHEELISSLHFMKKIASILEMESKFLLLQRGKVEEKALVSAIGAAGYSFETISSNATQIELHLTDQRGRSWPLSKLCLLHETVPLIECVPILSYERAVALMLEKEGRLVTVKTKEELTLESESRDSSS